MNFDKQEDTLSSSSNNIKSALELYKASQITIFQSEPVLERIYAWTSTYLGEELASTGGIQDKSLHDEVQHKLINNNNLINTRVCKIRVLLNAIEKFFHTANYYYFFF